MPVDQKSNDITHDDWVAPTGPLPLSSQKDSDTAQNTARRHLLEAVRHEGFQAKSVEDAWGKIVRVQAEIALDPAMGSKATTAAKFLAQALGIAIPKIETSENSPPELDNQAAENLLALIAAENKRRAEAP